MDKLKDILLFIIALPILIIFGGTGVGGHEYEPPPPPPDRG